MVGTCIQTRKERKAGRVGRRSFSVVARRECVSGSTKLPFKCHYLCIYSGVVGEVSKMDSIIVRTMFLPLASVAYIS